MRIEDLRQPVYLFPFTAEAVLVHHILKNYGITTKGFLDNNNSIHNESYDGISFLPPEKAAAHDMGAIVIICGFRHYELAEKLEALGFEPVKIERILRKEDVKTAVADVDNEAFFNLAPKQKDRLNRMEFEIKNVMLPPHVADNENSLILNAAEISITEKCSLKCLNCGGMMQYYKNPKHIKPERVIEDIDLIMQKADYIRNFSIIGGEPFIYPGLERILRHIGGYAAKIGALRITTNGTIVPKDDVMRAIFDSGVFVRVSNYGKLSKNIDALEKKLGEYQIQYQIFKPVWYKMNQLVYDCGKDRQGKYENCYSRIVCNTVMNNRLYYCEFLAQTENMRAIPYDAANHVNLKNPDVTKEDIASYIQSEKAPPGCAYCSGHDKNMDEIPAAEQCVSALEHKVFENYPPDY